MTSDAAEPSPNLRWARCVTYSVFTDLKLWGYAFSFLISMYRQTARILLLLTLVAAVAPIVLAASAPPAHACCVRKTRQCHEMNMSGMPPDAMPEPHDSGAVMRSAGCGPQACCRAMVVGSWAIPHPAVLADVSLNGDAVTAESHPNFISSGAQTSGSVRAPPSA